MNHKLIRKIINYSPLFFFLGIGLILFFPYLFQGRIPFPTSYLANEVNPWNRYLPNGPVKNGIPDVPGEIFPLRDLAINLWKNGLVPLWNPYAFSGTPLLANFQSAVFSPLNFLFFLLPHIDAWSILTLCQPLLAGVFTYFLLRNYLLTKISSLFGAVSFMFCGYLTVWGTYNTIGYTILILPLALLVVDKFINLKKIFYLPLITLLLSFSFFSGHIQSFIYVVIAVLIYSLVKIVVLNEDKNPRPFLLICLSVFLTVPLVAIQLLPTWEFYQYSGRRLVNNIYSGIPLPYFITLLAPDFFGNPVTRNSWYGNYPEWSGYLGQIALLFALFPLLFIKKDKRIIAYVFLGVIGLLMCLNSPVLSFLSSLPLPILKNSNPTRSIVLFSFAMSVLSAFGINYFISNKEDSPKKILIPLFLIGNSLVSLLFISYFGNIFSSLSVAQNLKSISFRNVILPAFIYLLTFISILLSFRLKSIKKILPVFLLILLTTEMLRFYFKWQPFDERVLFYKNTNVTDFLKSQPDYYRLHGFNQTPAIMENIYGIEGYEPLNLLDYSGFLRAAGSGKADKAYHLYVNLENRELYTKKILDLLGVRYFVYPTGDINNPFKFPIWDYHEDGYKQIFNDGKFLIYQNPDAFPKARTYSNYQIITNRDNLLDEMLTSKIDLTNTLFLEKNPGLSNTKLGTADIKIKKYSPNEIIISSRSDKPSLLFLNEIYYPGWQAFINQEEKEILRVNYLFRGLVVPQGENIIHFVYYPNSYKIGLGATLTSIIFLLFIFIYAKKKNYSL